MMTAELLFLRIFQCVCVVLFFVELFFIVAGVRFQDPVLTAMSLLMLPLMAIIVVSFQYIITKELKWLNDQERNHREGGN